MKWFFPSRSGDFRLETQDDSTCTLTVEDPSHFEYTRILIPFLKQMKGEGLVENEVQIAQDGKTVLPLSSSIQSVGVLLTQCLEVAKGDSWTAIRGSGGAIALLLDGADPAWALEQEPEAEAAVTVKKPARGCPPPVASNPRASEVLRAFSTHSQWADFGRTGSMKLIGNKTGRAYRVFHRTQAVNRGLGHLLVDDRGVEVCVWDSSVPAEEEVLAIKLAVEHNEGWLTKL